MAARIPKEIRLRSTREGWSLQIDDGEGEGLQEFPYVVGANPPPTLGPVVAGSPPLLTVTLPADRITVEHELRRGPRASLDG
jgi:hypothetical protein